jgi:nicotinamidase-related amidase
MAEMTFNKQLTALLVIDPDNDFISEGGKIWPRIKAVAEANNCVPHVLQVLNAARQAKLRLFYAIIIGTVRATTKPGSMLRLFRRRRGKTKASNTARGVAKSVPSSRPGQARSSPKSIGVPAASPTRISIYGSRSTASISSSSSVSSQHAKLRQRHCDYG